jgi:hypothetical protein
MQERQKLKATEPPHGKAVVVNSESASDVQRTVILPMSGRDGCESCVSSDKPHHRMPFHTTPTRLDISASGNHSAYLPIDNDSCATLSVELCFETPIQRRVSIACDDDAARSTVSVTQIQSRTRYARGAT